MSANGAPFSCTVSAAGTIAQFTVYDCNGNPVFSGSVTLTGSGGDIQLSSVTYNVGDTIDITSLTYTAPN
jgi:hypothetical protein